MCPMNIKFVMNLEQQNESRRRPNRFVETRLAASLLTEGARCQETPVLGHERETRQAASLPLDLARRTPDTASHKSPRPLPRHRATEETSSAQSPDVDQTSLVAHDSK